MATWCVLDGVRVGADRGTVNELGAEDGASSDGGGGFDEFYRREYAALVRLVLLCAAGCTWPKNSLRTPSWPPIGIGRGCGTLTIRLRGVRRVTTNGAISGFRGAGS